MVKPVIFYKVSDKPVIFLWLLVTYDIEERSHYREFIDIACLYLRL